MSVGKTRIRFFGMAVPKSKPLPKNAAGAADRCGHDATVALADPIDGGQRPLRAGRSRWEAAASHRATTACRMLQLPCVARIGLQQIGRTMLCHGRAAMPSVAVSQRPATSP